MAVRSELGQHGDGALSPQPGLDVAGDAFHRSSCRVQCSNSCSRQMPKRQTSDAGMLFLPTLSQVNAALTNGRFRSSSHHLRNTKTHIAARWKDSIKSTHCGNVPWHISALGSNRLMSVWNQGPYRCLCPCTCLASFFSPLRLGWSRRGSFYLEQAGAPLAVLSAPISVWALVISLPSTYLPIYPCGCVDRFGTQHKDQALIGSDS